MTDHSVTQGIVPDGSSPVMIRIKDAVSSHVEMILDTRKNSRFSIGAGKVQRQALSSKEERSKHLSSKLL